MSFGDDCVPELERVEVPESAPASVELRGTDRALLRALTLRTGLSEAEVLRVALLGLAAPPGVAGAGRLGR